MQKYFLVLFSLLIFGAFNLGGFTEVFPVKKSEVFAAEDDTKNDDKNKKTTTSPSISCSAQTHERFKNIHDNFGGSESFFHYVFYEALNELFFQHGIWIKKTGQII